MASLRAIVVVPTRTIEDTITKVFKKTPTTVTSKMTHLLRVCLLELYMAVLMFHYHLPIVLLL